MLKLNIQQMVNQRNQILLKNIILVEQFQLFNQIPEKETPCGIKEMAPQLLSDTTGEAKILLTLTKQCRLSDVKYSDFDQSDQANAAILTDTIALA